MFLPSTTLAMQMTQMAVQAPFVMAMRMGDCMTPGLALSPRQRREAHRMVAEKQAAAMEAWTAFGSHAMRAWTQWMLAPMQPWQPAHWERAGEAMVAPYARRVRANAARLRRRKR